MTVYRVDAKFNATWTNVGDFLARMGLQFDQTKTPAQIGTISADFAEKKTGGNDLVYVGIYGWTLNPLREYYILDDWGEMMPAGTASDGTPRTRVGTITVDGDTYEVWKKTRENKPNITGTDQTFDQYFSIRQNARQCGHISVSEHFSKWIGLGLQLGKLSRPRCSSSHRTAPARSTSRPPPSRSSKHLVSIFASARTPEMRSHAAADAR